jgi:tryptophanase
MMMADDSYAGSETFYRLESSISHFFGKKYWDVTLTLSTKDVILNSLKNIRFRR